MSLQLQSVFRPTVNEQIKLIVQYWSDPSQPYALSYSTRCFLLFWWHLIMPQLTNIQRAMAIEQLEAGVPNNVVCQTFNVHKSSINRLLLKFNAIGYVKDLPKSCRPCVIKQQEDNFIQTIVTRNRKLTDTGFLQHFKNWHTRNILFYSMCTNLWRTVSWRLILSFMYPDKNFLSNFSESWRRLLSESAVALWMFVKHGIIKCHQNKRKHRVL